MHEAHERHEHREIDGDEMSAINDLAKFCADFPHSPIQLFQRSDVYV